MELEHEFICWHAYQNEGDGKEIKAPSVQAAAKKAVDVWRHENLQELGDEKVTVYVKDQEKHTHKILVTGDGGPSAAEAFH